MENDKSKLSSLKALMILEAMSQTDSYTSINEISQMTGLSQSTVHRILSEMVEAGYADKNEQFKKYRVGAQAVIMSGRIIHSNSIVTAAQPELQKLNELTGETVHLLGISDGEVIYLDKLNTRHTLGLMSYIGKKNPMYCTSGGKCIMAFKSESWLEDYIARHVPFHRYTQFTLTDPEQIRQELVQIRQNGYALDKREHHDNLICVGAPVFDAQNNVIAAISVSAPSYRFTEEQAMQIAPIVKECAQAASARLGSTFQIN